jgi:glycosyltransferase involved in cell wall biosynthesis
MKVLVVSLFHPELIRGGAQQIAYELFEGLKAVPGVEPVLLASIDSSFPALFKSGARITGFDGRPNEYLFLSTGFDHWWNKISEPLLVEAFAEFLELIQPDVVHFHHFMTFGVELLSLTRRVLPASRIVFTFHEFLAICTADGHMVRRTDRSLCTRSSPVRCHQCFPEIAPEQFFLREHWMKAHLRAVDVFTTPSRFMQEHFVTWGLQRDKLVHISNGQRNLNPRLPEVEAGRKRNRFGFFGQMVDAKGVWLLLEAVEQLRAEGFDDFVVEINGDNLRYASEHRRGEIERFMAAEALRPLAEQNVIFNGSYHQDRIGQRMARIDWCIVPSVWWEIFGLVLSEAWMFGRPVIGSNVGGPAERIADGKDGLLFEVGDARALAATMRRAATEEGLWERLAAGITPPMAREEMVRQFHDLYAAGPGDERPSAEWPSAERPSVERPSAGVAPLI